MDSESQAILAAEEKADLDRETQHAAEKAADPYHEIRLVLGSFIFIVAISIAALVFVWGIHISGNYLASQLLFFAMGFGIFVLQIAAFAVSPSSAAV